MTSNNHLLPAPDVAVSPAETVAAYALRSELAQFCLPAAHQDAQRKLAWVDSLCLGFLIIGFIGIKPPVPAALTVAPLEEMVTTVIEPPPPTEPQELAPSQTEEITEQTPDSPQVVAVALPSPSFNFSVPTRGNLVVPAAMASAPPARPMQALNQAVAAPTAVVLRPQARGNDRPVPPWPYQLVSGGTLGSTSEIKQRGGLGTVVLLAVVETNGTPTSLTVGDSSGFPQLDRQTLDWVKRRWSFPRAATEVTYKIPIEYAVQ
jgi:protein TonB